MVDLGPDATQHYWDDRHAVAERWVGRWTARGWRPADYLHIALPVTRVLEYKQFADSVVARHGFEIRETAIWTDPRLFSIYFAGPDDQEPDGQAADGEIPPLWAAVDELLSGAIAMGEGVEYCHGLGTKLQAWVVEEWGDALPLARWLKQALDPNGTLNPRKLGLT